MKQTFFFFTSYDPHLASDSVPAQGFTPGLALGSRHISTHKANFDLSPALGSDFALAYNSNLDFAPTHGSNIDHSLELGFDSGSAAGSNFCGILDSNSIITDIKINHNPYFVQWCKSLHFRQHKSVILLFCIQLVAWRALPPLDPNTLWRKVRGHVDGRTVHTRRMPSGKRCSPNGEFDLKIVRALTCKGPKVKNCASVGIDLWPDGKGMVMNIKVVESFSPQVVRAELQNTNQKYMFRFALVENCGCPVSKVTAVSNGKQLVRLQMNNPCEHLFLRPLLESIFNVTKHCIIKTGTYKYEINIEKTAKEYFGGSFVYGELTFKSAMYSRDCNLSCVNLDVSMYPAKAS
ncbi:hypothetical protein EVAR_68525_1 [Eumeta japonica]|uniref:Uncharacterized protein n=1 Tax=Eumeta variegata TaxID=151549 RepID=A0A4C1ZBU2_EUMVA|nr:hypothetical protein EVAR_68525_1 [Eumeta japonica]